MQLDAGRHTEESALEQFAMGTLTEEKSVELEEHLLVCHTCQDRLAEWDAYLEAIRAVAPRLRHESPPVWEKLLAWLPRPSLIPKPVWAGAFAVLALAVLIGFQAGLLQPGRNQPFAVALSSSRGLDATADTRAPAGRPLLLSIDLTELPQLAAYRLQVVDNTGAELASLAPQPKDGKLEAITPRSFANGEYFVRLYSPSHELLREFKLRVE